MSEPQAPKGTYDLLPDDAEGRDLVVAASIGNQARGEHYLYDSGGQRRDVSKMVYAARFFVWNERQSRLYFLSENVSPRDICFEDVGSTGRFGKHE